ncbi:TonB-dependent receptor plug domain-containing protein [Paraglaciecola aquimarina]|uniref:TonB-dependent receptor plug domain-containing protein n=1 Tax=Paraglaciecola aquimarina TaxID=1235557 RepID=A0ABU3SW07_9ALTE|nr:TonB-dependent receptor plug domain-containing protein [Paraglaciecola aquimarina]MDU0354196.1 TonB-dependent receptor plug domain-containing protein [Paraglaciecola aquimarina]
MASTFRLSALSLAIIASMTAYAQEEKADSKVDKDKDIEIIEVTGYKGSLKKALNRKRFAENVVDSIHAEDIGKSTDQNIADALSRVTGISIQTQDGEGTRITIRGTQANENQIKLNGVTLTSGFTGDASSGGVSMDQSVDLSSFSADILSSIDVVKTPSADHDEGSLGATVILRTVKPLNVNKPVRTVTAQARYNEFTDQKNRKVNLSLSDKFFNDSLGFVLTASDETQNTRKDSMYSGWSENLVFVEAGRAMDTATNALTTEDMWAFHTGYNSMSLNMNKRDRRTGNLGIQYMPTDGTDLQLDISHTTQDLSFDTHNFSTNTSQESRSGGGAQSNNEADDPQELWWKVNSLAANEDAAVLVRNVNANTKGSINRRVGGSELKTDVVSLRLNQVITEDLVMDLNFGYSRTVDGSTRNIDASTATWNTLGGGRKLGEGLGPDGEDLFGGRGIEPGGWDCSTGQCQIIYAREPALYTAPTDNPNGQYYARGTFIPFDYKSSHLGGLTQYFNDSEDVNKSVFLDFDYDVEWGPVTQVEFGFKYSSRDRDVIVDKQQLHDLSEPVFDEDGRLLSGSLTTTRINASEFITGEHFPVDNFMEGISPSSFDLQRGWGLLTQKGPCRLLF